MRTTVTLDDQLLERAVSLTGVRERSLLLREALQALIERESARRLARLGGTEPDLEPAPRRRASLWGSRNQLLRRSVDRVGPRRGSGRPDADAFRRSHRTPDYRVGPDLNPFGPALYHHSRAVACLGKGLRPINGSVGRALLVHIRAVGRASRADPPFVVVAQSDGQFIAWHLVHRNPLVWVCRANRLRDLGAGRFGFLCKHRGHFGDGNIGLGMLARVASLDVV
jgi:hypothetical protein